MAQDQLQKSANKSQAEADKVLAEVETSLKDIESQIPDITAGIKSLAEIDLAQAPVLDTNAGEVTATGAGAALGAQGQINKFDTQLTEMIKNFQGQQTEETKGKFDFLKDLVTKKAEIIAGAPNIQELTTQLMAGFGFTPESMQSQRALIGQITAFNQQTANLEAAKQARLLGAEQKFQGRLTSALRGEQSLIERQYNSQISAKAAQAGVALQALQLERGLFQDALSMTNMIVNAVTYDQQQKIADLDWAKDTYIDLFNIMDSEERKQWDRSYKLSKDELDRIETEMTNKLGLVTDATNSGVNLGWSASYIQSQSLEELTTEFNRRVAGVVAADREGKLITFSDDQIRATIRTMERDMEEGLSNTEKYQRVVDEITLDDTLDNKERAIMIAGEIYKIGFDVSPLIDILKGQPLVPTPGTTTPGVPETFTPGEFGFLGEEGQVIPLFK